MKINPFDILKNAEAIQKQLSGFQEKLAGITVTGSAGGGMVEVDLSGKFEMLDIRIAPEVSGDKEMLEDLVIGAYSNAMEKAKAAIAAELGSFTGMGSLGSLASMLGGGGGFLGGAS
jgi:DNA-binding YbaB/EbfC family protein